MCFLVNKDFQGQQDAFSLSVALHVGWDKGMYTGARELGSRDKGMYTGARELGSR